MENIILFVVFAPFRYFLLFLIITIILLLAHPTRNYGSEYADDMNIKKVDQTLSIISFITIVISIIFAIICLFYYIKY